MVEEESKGIPMMNKRRVAVLMGGPSEEYEISLSSGKSMLEKLDHEKYSVTPVHILKNGEWSFDDGEPCKLSQGLSKLQELEIDVVLLALHGTFGEDGTLQALLEQQGVAFTGSKAIPSLLAMDKSVSNALYETAGLTVPISRSYDMSDSDATEKSIRESFDLPVVIKPIRQGSSVGVHIAKKSEDIYPAIQDAFLFDSKILVQKYIEGREVSCGVLERLDSDEVYALPPTELIPITSEFFDYEAKYSIGGAREVTPPDMPADKIEAIQSIAVEAHKVIGCNGYSRTDMIVAQDEIYVIETNTLPGMTPTSILPQQAAAIGMTFADLLDYLIEEADHKTSNV
jgi:D-alanine-D-alanine ligase